MHNQQPQLPKGHANSAAQRERLQLLRNVMLREVTMPAEEFMRLVRDIREQNQANLA